MEVDNYFEMSVDINFSEVNIFFNKNWGADF